MIPLLIVDGANVVGSVPDGWWRDRMGAARRLRDALAPLASSGLPPAPADGDRPEGERPEGPVEVVLVVEGAARGLPSIDGVRVVSATHSGDDEIVAQAAAGVRDARPVWVVTADRGLRSRVISAGARVLGPRTVRPA